MSTRIVRSAVLVSIGLWVASAANATVVTNFDDGTFQGWTPFGLSGASVTHVASGGNPNGHVHAVDQVGNGGSFGISAPVSYLGDLTEFSGIRWDERLLNPVDLTLSTTLRLIGQDGTSYQNRIAPGSVGSWRERNAPFNPVHWTLVPSTGSATFIDVLQDVLAMNLYMDVNVGTIPTLESDVDNIVLVPEPGSLLMLAACVLTIAHGRRRP